MGTLSCGRTRIESSFSNLPTIHLRFAGSLLALVLFRVCLPELLRGDPSSGGGIRPFPPTSTPTISYSVSPLTSQYPAVHSLIPITAHPPHFDGVRFLWSTVARWTNSVAFHFPKEFVAVRWQFFSSSRTSRSFVFSHVLGRTDR